MVMFGKKWEDLPMIRHAGTIIRLTGLKLHTYGGKAQFKWNAGSWALFHRSGRETTPFKMYDDTHKYPSEKLLRDLGALSTKLFQTIEHFDPYMTLLE